MLAFVSRTYKHIFILETFFYLNQFHPNEYQHVYLTRIGIMLLIVLMPVASVSTIVLQIQQVGASANANASAQSSKNELSDMVLEK